MVTWNNLPIEIKIQIIAQLWPKSGVCSVNKHTRNLIKQHKRSRLTITNAKLRPQNIRRGHSLKTNLKLKPQNIKRR